MKSIIIIFCFLAASIINAQVEPDPASFFPSAVGNIWEYDTQYGFSRRVIESVSYDEDSSKFLFPSPTFKIDTAYFVYYLPFNLNWKLYKLDADSGETWKVRTDPPGTLARVDRIYKAYLWGKKRNVKEIGYYRPPYPFEDTTITEDAVYERYVLLVSGVGEYYEFNMESGPARILRGCIIDGDTLGTITAVNEKYTETLPYRIELYQNYPNPFNPSTTIEYDLVSSGKVTLKIYNILGKEVRTLAEGNQQKGKHKIIFNARNLPSGVYFYQLITGNYKLPIIRKMIYMK